MYSGNGGMLTATMWQALQPTMQWVQRAALVLLLAPQILGHVIGQHLLHSFGGSVGSENFTYYKLGREGAVTVVLLSVKGDADLYISDKTLLPNYENYELQSATCGEDRVDIPADFKRPVGIAVYGHPSSKHSKFKIEVYIENESDKYTQPHQHHHKHRGTSPGKEEEEESVLWAIFVSILKIILDILV